MIFSVVEEDFCFSKRLEKVNTVGEIEGDYLHKVEGLVQIRRPSQLHVKKFDMDIQFKQPSEDIYLMG